MGIRFRDEQLASIEKAFQNMIDNPDQESIIRKSCSTIESVLRLACDKRFVVSVIESPPTDELYGMSVRPSQAYTDQLVSMMLDDEKWHIIVFSWKDIKDWVIGIDKRMIKKEVGMNAAELTTILLHEIGHIVLNTSFGAKLENTFRRQLAQAGFEVTNMARQSFFSKIMQLPLINLMSTSRYKDDGQLKEEIKADKFAAVNPRYREALISAIGKMMEVQPVSTSTSDDEVKLALSTINNYKKRQAKLVNVRRLFKVPKSKNMFTRESVFDISESCDDTYIENKANEIYNDGMAMYFEFFSFKEKKLPVIDNSYITYIENKIKEIKDEDDKAMLIEYTKSKITMIDWYISLLEHPEFSKKYIITQSAKELNTVKNALNNILKTIINFKIDKDPYNLKKYYNLDCPKFEY
nr:MAG TPA: hypothetical protein [Caudoviricetes sp.]